MKRYKALYLTQRSHAKRRGIEWKLTFDQWLEWWGDDIDRRGVGHDQLQMQRYGDMGAYEIGNIKKGHPRDNSRTSGRIRRAGTAVFVEQFVEEFDVEDLSFSEYFEKTLAFKTLLS